MLSLPAHDASLLDEGALLAAANFYHAKLRLARIDAALELLRALRPDAPPPHVQDQGREDKTRYLIDLHDQQKQVENDGRECVIATSRRDVSSGGFPQWQAYMDRIFQYRQLGVSLAQAHPDRWRDEVLEHVEAMSPRHGHCGIIPPSVAPIDSPAGSTSELSIATLSPAGAEHLLLYEESQVVAPGEYDTAGPSSNDLTNSCTSLYDTDPGTPYVSGPGTETDSVSSGPISPTDDFIQQELPFGSKQPSPAPMPIYAACPPIRIFPRQFLTPADAPKSRPFSYEDIYTLYEIFDKTGIEYYIFERKRDSLHQMEVKSCQKVDLLRPFVEVARRFTRPSTHTQIPLEILLRMSRVIVNSFAWPQPGETWREFLEARTDRYRREKEELDARIAPELRRAEHADFCYSFMLTVTEYIGDNPALLDSIIDGTRLRENDKWDYVLAYRCIWENLGLIRYAPPPKMTFGPLLTIPQTRTRVRPRLVVENNEGISKILGPHPSRPMRRVILV